MQNSKLLFSTALISAIVGIGAASAADIAPQSYTKATVAAPVTVYDWTGFYIGGDVGGGFEWMFTQSSWGAWSMFVEYDHIFLSNRDLLITPVVGPAFTANIRRDFDKVLFGINLRFGGGGGPVRASY